MYSEMRRIRYPLFNLLTKVEPFNDNFNDDDYAGWTMAGSWAASDHVLTKTSTLAEAYAQRSHSDPDSDIWFAYRQDASAEGAYLQGRFRYVDSNNFSALQISQGSMQLAFVVNGSPAYVSNANATSSTGTWYEVYLRSDGQNVTVYRRVKGQGMFQQVLTTSTAPSMTTGRFQFYLNTQAQYSIDNVRIVANSLSSTVAYAYDTEDRMDQMSKDGMTTVFYYDYWGRQKSKDVQSGAHTASYRYRYDSKMCTATSNFPDESNLTLVYDGLGKLRQSDGAATSNYRWDRGWNLINIEASDGTLQNTVWYQPPQDAMAPLGMAAGANPSSGATWSYFLSDYINSIRETRLHDRTVSGEYEYTPYGDDYFRNGALPEFGFTGKRRFDELGEYYFPYRMYSPGLARWLMRDPAGTIDSVNAYYYAKENPVNVVDPDGAQTIVLEAAAVVAIGCVMLAMLAAIQSREPVLHFGLSDTMAELRRIIGTASSYLLGLIPKPGCTKEYHKAPHPFGYMGLINGGKKYCQHWQIRCYTQYGHLFRVQIPNPGA